MTRRLGGIGSKSLAALASLSLAATLAGGFAITGCGGDNGGTPETDAGDGGLPDAPVADNSHPDVTEAGMDAPVDRGVDSPPDVTADNNPPPDTGTMMMDAGPACGSPTFAPNGGMINQGSSVTISAPMGFPSTGYIFYTTNGTLPTHNSLVITGTSGMVQVNANETIYAIAFAQGVCTDSAPASAMFTVIMPPPPDAGGPPTPPAFNPTTTAQGNDFHVTLSSTPGATICYTTDGTNPTCSNGACGAGSQTYGGTGVSIDGTVTNSSGQVTVNALACTAAAGSSTVTTQPYGLTADAPTFAAPAPSTIPYTGATSATPTLSTTTQSSTTNSTTNVPFIRYTTDGSTPTCAIGTEVNGNAGGNSGTVSVTQDVTFNAIACKNGYAPSAVTTATYTVQANAPGVTNGTGTYYDTVSPGLTAGTNPTVTLCYSTTGNASCGTTAGTCGTGSTDNSVTAASITTTGTMLSSIACSADTTKYANSAVGASQTYTLNLRTVDFSPVTGNPIPSGSTLTVDMYEDNTSSPNAAWNLFCYTTDGVTMPDCTCTGTNQNMGRNPMALGPGNNWASPAIGPTTTSVTIMAIGCDTTGAFNNTGVLTANYPNAGTMGAPTLVPAATSALNNDQMITFANTDTTEAAKICYTSDGTTTPTCTAGGAITCIASVAVGATSTTGPTINATNAIVQAIACDAGSAAKANSSVSRSTYTMQVATPTISPNGGNLTIGGGVTLSTATKNAFFVYTTNGSTPTCAGGGSSTTINASTSGTGPYTALVAMAGTETQINVIGCRVSGTNGAAGNYTASTGVAGSAITGWSVAQPTFKYGTGTFDDTLPEVISVNPANPAATVTWLCLGSGASCGTMQGTCSGVGSTPVTGLTCATNTDGVTSTCSANRAVTVSGTTFTAIACAKPGTPIVQSPSNSASYTLDVSGLTFSPTPAAQTAPITVTVSLTPTATPPDGTTGSPGATGSAFICVSSTQPVPAQPSPCSSFTATAGWTCNTGNSAAVSFTDVGKNTTYNAFACKDGLVYSTLSGQAYTFTPFSATIPMNGVVSDYTNISTTEFNISGQDSATAYVSWDATYLYVGTNVSALAATDVIELYVGGTTSAVTGADTHTPFSTNALPTGFNALYHLWWTANGSSQGVNACTGGTAGACSWGTTASTFDVKYNGGASTFVEFRIPLSDFAAITDQDLHLLGDQFTTTPATKSAWPSPANSDTAYTAWQRELLNDAFVPNDANSTGTLQ